jgi:hypothetical protein
MQQTVAMLKLKKIKVKLPTPCVSMDVYKGDAVYW